MCSGAECAVICACGLYPQVLLDIYDYSVGQPLILLLRCYRNIILQVVICEREAMVWMAKMSTCICS